MDILIWLFCVPAAYLILGAATVEMFYRKGHSWILGLVVAIFLPVIGLIVALVMPYDQPALEERKQGQQYDEQQSQKRYARWKREYEERHAAGLAPLPPLPDYTEPPALATVQTICAVLLILCPLAAAMQPGEIATAALGLVSCLALLGLVVAILFPLPVSTNEN